jgi:hypothetical protein
MLRSWTIAIGLALSMAVAVLAAPFSQNADGDLISLFDDHRHGNREMTASRLPMLNISQVGFDADYSEAGVYPYDREEGTLYAPSGNGYIVIGDPAEDPFLPILLTDDPNSIWYSRRANLFGQEVSDEWDFYNLINTDRPDFTDATYSVGRGVTIIENGYTMRVVHDFEATNRQSRRSLPETLVRYGITDEFEWRIKWNGYEMVDIHNQATGVETQVFGGDDLYLGFKYEVWQQEVWKPMFTFLSGSTVPVGTNGISSNALQPFLNGVIGWGIRRWLYLKMSAGIDWQRISQSTLIGGGSEPFGPTLLTLRDHARLYHGSVSMLYQATRRVGGFVEFFNLSPVGASDDRPANYFDTGLFIYATTNLQFDVRIGKRVGERVNEVFTGAGLSIRF